MSVRGVGRAAIVSVVVAIAAAEVPSASAAGSPLMRGTVSPASFTPSVVTEPFDIGAEFDGLYALANGFSDVRILTPRDQLSAAVAKRCTEDWLGMARNTDAGISASAMASRWNRTKTGVSFSARLLADGSGVRLWEGQGPGPNVAEAVPVAQPLDLSCTTMYVPDVRVRFANVANKPLSKWTPLPSWPQIRWPALQSTNGVLEQASTVRFALPKRARLQLKRPGSDRTFGRLQFRVQLQPRDPALPSITKPIRQGFFLRAQHRLGSYG